MSKSIDRADWHYGGDYPKDLPPENGGTHIGMYLAWIIHQGLASAKLQKLARDSLQQLRERRVTGRQLLFSELDEKFFDALLTRVGKDFTRDYYETNAYLEDYANLLGDSLPSIYHVQDSWENYDRLALVIQERFSRWQQGELPQSELQAELKEAEDKFVDTILSASRQLPADPPAAIQIMNRYLSTEPLPVYRDRVIKEIEIVRAKYGVE